MTSGFAAGYKIESGEARALRSINADSYDYRDQGKLLSKLTSDVSYMAQYMRNMQKGIDDANANFIEQIGDFVNEILVVIGGGGNTSFDFGDLKYIFQAIGALFGFDQQTGIGAIFPINLFNAAGHFFSTYILPLNNFGDAVDNFIDTSLATVLDVLGEVPIVGQAAQILATWISDLRDGVTGIGTALDDTIDDLGQLITDLWTNPAATIQSISQSMVTGLQGALTNLNTFIQDVIDNIISALSGIPVIGGAIAAISTNIKALFQNLFRQDTQSNTVSAAAVPALDGAKIQSGSVAAARIADLDANKITTGSFGSSRIGTGAVSNDKLGTDISGDKIVAGTVIAARVGNLDGSKITTGTIGTAIVPNLDAGKITSGAFADSRIPTLDAAKIGTGTFGSGRITDGAISNIKLGTDISGDKIVAGTVVAGRIGNLDGSKITTGSVAEARVENLTTAKNNASSALTNAATAQGLISSSIKSGSNIIPNPGFESTNFNNSALFSTEQKRSGSRSLKLTGTGSLVDAFLTNDNVQTLFVPCSPGDVYYMEFWIYGHANNVGGGLVQMFMSVYDAALGGLVFPALNINPASTAYKNVWTKVSGYTTALPANSAQMHVRLRLGTAVPTTDSYYFDDVICYRVTESANTNVALYNQNTPLSSILSGAVPGLDASKITGGTLGTSIVPNLDAGKITTGSFLDARIPSLAATKITSGTFTDGLIPSLNASKINAGTFVDGLIPSLNASKINAGTFLGSLIPGLDVSKITTGIFGDAFIPNLAATKITSGTFTDGLIPSLAATKITSGTFLGTLIPGLDVSKIITGTFGDTFIPSLAATKITSGTFTDGLIPSLAASKITSGSFLDARIPNLDGSKITSGSVAEARVENLTTTKNTANTALGVTSTAQLSGSNLLSNFGFENTSFANAAEFSTEQAYQGSRSWKKTVTGADWPAPFNASATGTYVPFQVSANDSFYFEMWLFPHNNNTTVSSGQGIMPYIRGDDRNGNQVATPGFWIDTRTLAKNQWHKISGTLSIGNVPTVAYGWMTLHFAAIETGNIYYVDNASMHRVTETVATNTALYNQNTPLSTIITGAVPGLDASKITGGTLGTTIVPNLDAAKITTGAFGDARIPNLAATKITSGTFTDGLIPSLAATKITSGTFLDGLIPNLNASKITAGSFLDARIPSLDGSKISTGSVAEARIASLSTAKITTGTFGTAFIADAAITGVKTASLDASKVTTGTMAQTQVTSLTTDLGNRVDYSAYTAYLSGGANLCTNPGFEDTTQNLWSGVYETTPVRTGSRSASLTSSGADVYMSVVNNKVGSFRLTGSPSEKFYVEMWVRGNTGNTYLAAGSHIGIGIWSYDTNENYIAANIAWISTQTLGTGNWVKVSGTLTVDSNSTIAKSWPLILISSTVPSGNKYFFDDVVVKNVTEAANTNVALYNQNTPLSSITTGAVPGLDGSKITGGIIAEARVENLITAKNNASTALTNANTADNKAVVAQGLTETAQRAGSNLLSNFGFENTSFSNASQFSTEQAYAGTRSWKWTVPGDTWISPFHATTTGFVHFPASPGDSYYYEMWVFPHSNNTTVNNGTSFYPYIAFNNAANNEQVATAGFSVDTRTLVKGQWNKVSGYLTAGNVSTIAQGVFVLHWNSSETGNVFYVDNASLYRVTETVATNKALYNQNTPASSIITGAVPGLDASKITGGTLNNTTIPNLDVSKITTGAFADARIPNLSTAKITTGTFSSSFIADSAITNIKLGTDISGDKIVAGTVTAARVGSLDAAKITTGTFSNAMIAAGLDAAKLTTGTLPVARIGSGAITNTYLGSDISGDKISAGTVAAARIAALDTAKITTGSFLDARIPGLDGSKITGGTVAEARIASLSTAKITTGTFGTTFIPNLDTAKITTGAFLDARIPGLDGSKITGGTIAEARVQNLTVAREDIQLTFNKIAGVLTTGEDTATGTVIDNVVASLTRTYITLQDHSIEIQKLQSEKTSAQVKGVVYNINFNSYANGQFTDGGAGTNSFKTIYTGAGTSLLGVQSGVAQWYSTNNADRNALVIWNKPTNTDFQIISGTMTTPPVQAGGGAGTPKFHAVGRCNSAGNTYLWARAYCDGFLSFKGEIGCTVAGVETQWASNIPLTWNLDMKFVVGVGTDARQYQVYSGSTLVWTHTESGTSNVNYSTKTSTSAVQSTMGASNRQWGCLAQIRGGTGGPYHSGKLSGASVSDNQTPQVNGSVARMDRTSTATVSYTGGGALTAIPNSFFNVIDYESPDIDADATTSSFTVKESKAYMVTARIMTGNVAAWGTLILQMWNGSAWVNAQFGNPIYTQDGVAAISGQWIQYLNAGEKVRLAYERAGITTTTLTGEATGTKTYFAIAGMA